MVLICFGIICFVIHPMQMLMSVNFMVLGYDREHGTAYKFTEVKQWSIS